MRISKRSTRAAMLAACLAVTATAAAAGGAPRRAPARAAAASDRLVVGFQRRTSAGQRAAIVSRARLRALGSVGDGQEIVGPADGVSVEAVAAALRRDGRVAYAVPDYRVHAAGFIPDDPGYGGGWRKVQWNFAGPNGVGAPAAWAAARRDRAPGGRGVTVAVVDSGVAFERHGRFLRSPDLVGGRRFVAPYDFLDRTRHPDDPYGHGTHVTSTIAEATDNGVGVTGLAYDVNVMPLRVLDRDGNGDGATVARAIRYAVAHHAQVINLSVEFDSSVRARDIPYLIDAMRYAYLHGVTIVGAAGNESGPVSYPAASRYVIAVGATTADGCLAGYSNFGRRLALVAPGGGSDAAPRPDAYDRAHCHPARRGRGIVQEAYLHRPRHFRLTAFHGTSFATPHVTAAVALIIATRRLGRHPSPAALRRRLLATARPLGRRAVYGAGLLDIAAALGA